METAENLAQCSICKELFTDPRMLPCIHNFCLQCLQESASQVKKRPGDKLACHCCGKEFTVPLGGVAGLQKSLFIGDLVEEIRAAKKRGSQCDACLAKSGGKDDCLAPAMMYCSECRQKLCSACSEHHRKRKVSKKHRLTKMEFKPNEQLSSTNCSLHNQHQLSVYCFECRVIVCDECCKQTHAMHTCKSISEVTENSKKQITTDLEKLAVQSKDGLTRKEQLEKIKTKSTEGFVNIEAEIIERGRKLKEMVDAHVGCLLSQLILMKTKRMHEIDMHIDEIKTCLELTESFEIRCKDVLLKTSTLEICTEAIALNSKAVKIQKLYESCYMKDLSLTAVTLESEERISQLRNIVGEIKEVQKPVTRETDTLTIKPMDESSDTDIMNFPSAISTVNTEARTPVPDEAISMVIDRDLKPATFQTAFDPSGIRLSTKLTLDANVCGITKLSNCIYVLSRNPNVIHIFQNQNKKSFSLTSQIQISDIKKPHDIAAAKKLNCLFITDSETSCVWKITSDNTITKWLTNIGEPFTLFVTPDLRLVMARQGRPSRIEIYKEDSSVDCIAQLPINIEEPLHAVENSQQNFVVSGKWRESGARETVWSISMTDQRGEILHRFFAKDKVQCLKEPQYLSVDSMDQVLVADFGNGRVVLLNSDLSYNQSLEAENKDAIMFPKRLYLDSEGRQLLVGQYLKKGVHVYTF